LLPIREKGSLHRRGKKRKTLVLNFVEKKKGRAITYEGKGELALLVKTEERKVSTILGRKGGIEPGKN